MSSFSYEIITSLILSNKIDNLLLLVTFRFAHFVLNNLELKGYTSFASKKPKDETSVGIGRSEFDDR